MNEGQLVRYSLPQNTMPLNHLCFADYLIIFTQAIPNNIKLLFRFLKVYEIATGQLINKSKSSFVISKHCPPSQIRWITDVLLSRATLPFKYLENFLFKGRLKAVYFQHLFEKVYSKLASWKGWFLSPGGRLILIKHVITAIPTYTFVAFAPSQLLMAKLERAMASFLCRHGSIGIL